MQEIINSKLLHLFCMLLCIAIVAYFFIRFYSKGKDIDSNDKRIQKLHTFYIAGILGFLIIELITGLCMGQEDHVEILSYVSFAATLSSLIMSIVAIIFTIVYSSRGDEQYKKIDNASDKVSRSLDEFSVKTKEIDDSISSFKEKSDILTSKIDTIICDLKYVKGITEDIKDSTSNNKREVSSSSDAPLNNNLSDNQVKVLIENGSFNGNCALYACVLSCENKMSFSLSDISSGLSRNIDYMYGYLIAASAIGIINGKLDRDNCLISSVADSLKSYLETEINDFINSNKKFQQRRQEKFEKIKSCFELKEQ